MDPMSDPNDQSQLARKLIDQVNKINRCNTALTTDLRKEQSYTELVDAEEQSSTIPALLGV